MRFAASIVLIALCIPVVPAQFLVDLNVNAPISASTGDVNGQIQPSVIADLGVDTVRVNCILGPWSSPSDSTLHGSPARTWFETYDTIVDGFLAEGIDIYMLIGAEAVAGSSRAAFATDAWTQSYADNFLAIVDHFKDRVQVFETFNEPNDWAGGGSAQVEPRWFAYQLQEIYLAVKYGPSGSHLSDASYQNLIIVSGPLFTHDIGGSPSPGDTYWTQTRTAGISGDATIPDLDWGNVHTLTGSYPYDGLGYHIYVEGETDSVSTITSRYQSHINAFWSSVTALEGMATSKQMWVSEFGWNRDSLATGLGAAEAPYAQGRNLETAMNLLRSDSRVALGSWFSLIDFGGVGDTWGLYTGPLLSGNRNPVWWHLRWQGLIGDGASNQASNAGFETGDLTGWTEYGTTDGVITGTWLNGITAHSGSYFHGAAANLSQKDGGVYQQFIVTAGDRITAGARVRTYREGGSAGDTACRIGIDPTGSTNPDAGTVVWSEELETENHWMPLAVEAVASSSTVTVFLDHVQVAPTWNITCFDDVAVLSETAPEEADETVDFGADMDSLPHQPSDSDLINGLIGTIDQGGFHGSTSSQASDLTDGVPGSGVAVLADYLYPALRITYDLGSTGDISEVRVFSQSQDGRLFQNWGLEISSNGTDFSTVEDEVLTEPDGAFPSSLSNGSGSQGQAALTTLSQAGGVLASGRYLRFTFQPVSEVNFGEFWDPVDAGQPGDTDGEAAAYVAPTIAEIDVFGVAPTAPDIAVSPASWDFGSHELGQGASDGQSFVIANEGDADLGITGVSLEGDHAGDFAIVSDTGESTLSPSAERTVQIVFEPTVAGARSASLVVTSSDPDEQTVTCDLTGTGVETPSTGVSLL